MILFTGNFEALKKRFLAFIAKNKLSPLERVLVVLPSQRLQNSLKKELADKNGCVSGFSFLDFTALSAEINFSADADAKPLLPAGAEQDFIIKNILSKNNYLPASRGFCKAVKAAFRDLTAANITPEDLTKLYDEDDISSIKEERPALSEFIIKQKQDLTALAACYKEYNSKITKKNFDTYGDFFKKATQNVQENPFLNSFAKIIFFGFYDLTDLQYALFEEICANYDCAVFFPYEKKAAFAFTKPFFESKILPKATERTELPESDSPLTKTAFNIFEADIPKTENADIKIISVSGLTAEVQAAAKEVLILKEKYNIPFNRIAVFARSMENYKNLLPAVFEQNQIPVNYNFEFPLCSHPFAAFIYNLLNLGRNNYYSADASAVLISPYFKHSKPQWREIIKNSGITGGLSQWENLPELYADERDEEKRKKLKQDFSKIKEIMLEIAEYYTKIEASGSFDELAETTIDFIEKFTKENIAPAEKDILKTVKNIINGTGRFSQIKTTADEKEFLEEVLCALKEATYNKAQSLENAVEAGDVMALRGQSFNAAVFLGMNEGLFPATPAPDPILKEEYRLLLKELGSLIHTQNERYFEEKLLFALALSSVKSKAVFVFQRSDDNGKPQIPSLYLSRLAQSIGKNISAPDLVLSRRESEKLKQWPLELLNNREAALLTVLSKDNSYDENIVFTFLNPEEKENDSLQKQLKNAASLNYAGGSLTDFDGIINKNSQIYKDLSEKAVSPSSLSNLWLCPCKFLLKKITYADDPTKFERAKMPANVKGTLYHEILQNFYTANKNILANYFEKQAGEAAAAFADSYLNKQDYKKYGLYPLAWFNICEEIKNNIAALVSNELPKITEKNLKPAFFEKELEAEIDFDGEKIKLSGKIDRIDVNDKSADCRIVDYKSSVGKDSIIKIIVTKNLQPPLYMLMVKNTKDKELAGLNPLQADLVEIGENDKPKSLTAEIYAIIQKAFEQAVKYRIELIKEGVFIITCSDDTCKYCPYGDICRKSHQPSRKRMSSCPYAKELKQKDSAILEYGKTLRTTARRENAAK